jgi:hypothetical protein
MAVVHFLSIGPDTPECAGYVDGNVFHVSEPAIDEKYIIQQFIYSHGGWDVSTESAPLSRLTEDTI